MWLIAEGILVCVVAVCGYTLWRDRNRESVSSEQSAGMGSAAMEDQI